MKKFVYLFMCLYAIGTSAEAYANDNGTFMGRGSAMLRGKSSVTSTMSSGNMGGTMQQATTGVMPVGTIIIWSVSGNPTGWDNGEWLECNGSAIPSDSSFNELRTVLGGANTTPNYAGMFLRGHGSQSHSQENGSTVGVTSTTHSSGGLGVVQGDAIREIKGETKQNDVYETGWNSNHAWGSNEISSGAMYSIVEKRLQLHGVERSHESYDSLVGYGINTSYSTPTANEIRPINTAVRYLIRAK